MAPPLPPPPTTQRQARKRKEISSPADCEQQYQQQQSTTATTSTSLAPTVSHSITATHQAPVSSRNREKKRKGNSVLSTSSSSSLVQSPVPEHISSISFHALSESVTAKVFSKGEASTQVMIQRCNKDTNISMPFLNEVSEFLSVESTTNASIDCHLFYNYGH
jgi:type II secretory pathway component PulL